MSIKLHKNDFPGNMRTRLAKAEQTHGDRNLFTFHAAAGMKPTVIAVNCLECGTPVQQMIPHPDYKNRMMMAQTVDYDTMLIEFDDGSKHELPICKRCKGRIGDDPDKLDALFLADMAGSLELNKNLAGKRLQRKAVRRSHA